MLYQYIRKLGGKFNFILNIIGNYLRIYNQILTNIVLCIWDGQKLY